MDSPFSGGFVIRHIADDILLSRSPGQKALSARHMAGTISLKRIKDFRAETGEEGFWNSRMFSGMPAFQGNIKHKNTLGGWINAQVRGSFSQPIGIFIIMAASFYIFVWLSV